MKEKPRPRPTAHGTGWALGAGRRAQPEQRLRARRSLGSAVVLRTRGAARERAGLQLGAAELRPHLHRGGSDSDEAGKGMWASREAKHKQERDRLVSQKQPGREGACS